jgi:hypothetical protein
LLVLPFCFHSDRHIDSHTVQLVQSPSLMPTMLTLLDLSNKSVKTHRS